MSNKIRHYLINPRQDHPIPIETVENVDTKFDVIRENIEILWERVKQLKLTAGESASKGGSIAAPSTPSVPSTPVVPTPTIKREKISLFDENGEIVLLASWTDLTFDSQDLKDTIFNHTLLNSEVTVNDNGEFEIITEGDFKSHISNNQVCEIRIVRDSGSGYQEIPGSRAYCTL